MVETPNKLGFEVINFNIIKAFFGRPTSDIILNGKNKETKNKKTTTKKTQTKTKQNKKQPYSLSPKVRNKTSMSTVTAFIQHSTGSLSHSSQITNRNKRHPTQ